MTVSADESIPQLIGTTELLSLALLIIDENRTIIRTNRLAKALLDRKLLFTARNGRLIGQTRVARQLLNVEVRSASERITASCKSMDIIVSRLTNDPLDVFGHRRKWIIVQVTGYPIDRVARQLLVSQRFGATTVEALVADLIGAGWSVGRIAESLRRSPHTIRTHVKRLCAKTGANSQRQLAAIITGLVSSNATAVEVFGEWQRT